MKKFEKHCRPFVWAWQDSNLQLNHYERFILPLNYKLAKIQKIYNLQSLVQVFVNFKLSFVTSISLNYFFFLIISNIFPFSDKLWKKIPIRFKTIEFLSNLLEKYFFLQTFLRKCEILKKGVKTIIFFWQQWFLKFAKSLDQSYP